VADAVLLMPYYRRQLKRLGSMLQI